MEFLIVLFTGNEQIPNVMHSMNCFHTNDWKRNTDGLFSDGSVLCRAT